MKQSCFEIAGNDEIAQNTFKMVLRGDTSEIRTPGQFVNIALSGRFLRRPISVCDWDGETLLIIYKTVGGGTRQMAHMQPGETLDLLTGLGNGYDSAKSGDAPLLLGGGAGVPPLYALAKRLIAEGKTPTVILGFNTAPEVFFEAEFQNIGAKTVVTTADGSRGVRGFVTDAMERAPYTYVYCCGPEAMLRAVFDKTQTGGQFSFEERMGCGFGACMGCTCRTKYENKRICKDGPVLLKEEIIW